MTDAEVEHIEARMREIIAADLPFGKKMMSVQDCCRIYESQHQIEKVNLLKTLGRFNYNVYMLDGYIDTFYGPLVPSTGLLSTFSLMAFNDGFCLQYPMEGDTLSCESTVIDYLTNTSFPIAHFRVAPSEDTGLSQDTASPQKSSGTSL